jgi:hypothetical protein
MGNLQSRLLDMAGSQEIRPETMKQPQVKRFTATGMNGQPVRPGVVVMAQVSPDLKGLARRAATDAGCSVSEWLRRLIVKELAK